MLLLFSLVYLTRLRYLLSSAISEGFTLRAGGVSKQKGRGGGGGGLSKMLKNTVFLGGTKILFCGRGSKFFTPKMYQL